MTRPKTSLPAALALLLSPATVGAASAPSMAFMVPPRPPPPGFAGAGAGRYGLDLSWRSESRDGLRSGTSPVPNPRGEKTSGWRASAVFDARAAERLTLLLAVPYSSQRFQFGPGLQTAQGLGDVAVYAKFSAWRDRPRDARAELAVLGGVELPTGSTRLTSNGARLAATQQPGSGSTDLLFGASGFSPAGPAVLYADLSYKLNTPRAYTFGNVLTADAGALFPVPGLAFLSLTAETALDASEPDESDAPGPGVAPDGSVVSTGGETLSFAPGLELRLPWDLTARAAVRFPVYQRLNGTQLAGERELVFGLRARWR